MQLRFEMNSPRGINLSDTASDFVRVNSLGNLIINNGNRAEVDQVRARDNSGLSLFNDDGLGLVILDTTGHIVASNNVRLEIDEVRARDTGHFVIRDANGNLGISVQHADGGVGIGVSPIFVSGPGINLDINGTTLRLRTARTPANAGATGSQGEICWDSGFAYFCINTNTWRRIAHVTW